MKEVIFNAEFGDVSLRAFKGVLNTADENGNPEPINYITLLVEVRHDSKAYGQHLSITQAIWDDKAFLKSEWGYLIGLAYQQILSEEES